MCTKLAAQVLLLRDTKIAVILGERAVGSSLLFQNKSSILTPYR